MTPKTFTVIVAGQKAQAIRNDKSMPRAMRIHKRKTGHREGDGV